MTKTNQAQHQLHVHPILQTRVDNPDYALSYLEKVCASFGINDRWAYRTSYSNKEWFGPVKNTAEDYLANADLVFNVSGSTKFEKEGLKTGRLVYYGTDPVYHEIKFAQGDAATISIIN